MDLTREARIRDARIDDAPAIARIHVTMWRHAYRDYLPPSMLDGLSIVARERGWRAQLSALPERAALLVAEQGGAVVGFCALGPCRDENAPGDIGELYAIYVAPDRARAGIGGALMQMALRRLGDAGFHRARLWVLTDNAPARAFYERHGWTTDGATKTEAVPGGQLRETRYVRSLDARAATSPSPARDA